MLLHGRAEHLEGQTSEETIGDDELLPLLCN